MLADVHLQCLHRHCILSIRGILFTDTDGAPIRQKEKEMFKQFAPSSAAVLFRAARIERPGRLSGEPAQSWRAAQCSNSESACEKLQSSPESSFDMVVPKPWAMWRRLLRVKFCSPRSTEPMKLRCSPRASANDSWVYPFLMRNFRMRRPSCFCKSTTFKVWLALTLVVSQLEMAQL